MEEPTVDIKKNFVPIGWYDKVKDLIHLGRDQWLQQSFCSDIALKSTNTQKCAGHILTSVFGISTLMKSTVTGRESDASTSKTKIMDSKVEIQKLDSLKLEACRDYYHYCLEQLFNLDTNSPKYKLEKSKFNEYASKKIAYLKKPPKAQESINKRSKQKDQDDQGADVNETVTSSNNTENEKTILSVDIETQPKEKLNLIEDENNYIIDLNNGKTDDQMQVKDPLALHSGDGQLNMNQEVPEDINKTNSLTFIDMDTILSTDDSTHETDVELSDLETDEEAA